LPSTRQLFNTNKLLHFTFAQRKISYLIKEITEVEVQGMDLISKHNNKNDSIKKNNFNF